MLAKQISGYTTRMGISKYCDGRRGVEAANEMYGGRIKLSLNCQQGVLSDLLHIDDLALMIETIKVFRNMFLKWKEAFESKAIEDNPGKITVMVSGGITWDSLFNGKVDPCEFYSLGAKANSVLCMQCGKWIHSRCAVVKG